MSNKQNVLWLRERDVVDLISLSDAVGALEAILPLEDRGLAINAPKSLITWDGAGSLHSLSSASLQTEYGGTKTWINTPTGATAIYVLFDREAGTVLSVIEANALGSLRTAGIVGLASRWLAPASTDEATIIGAGRQALLQVAALVISLPLRRLHIYSRTRARQLDFADQVEREFGLPVARPESVDAAVNGVPVVTAITRAREPFLHADMLARDVHVNALGAILPQNAEFHRDVFQNADVVVVDNLLNARKTSRELRDFYGEGETWPDVKTLGQWIAAGQRRPADCRLSLFKSVGMGLSDLAVAIVAYKAARTREVGVQIDYPAPATVRWRDNRTDCSAGF